MGKPVKITDTTFRDAHQSLMATRMRTDSMVHIAEKMDQVGFFSLEVWGGATFDVCVRYLNEDPWERIRTLKKHVKKTPLQMLLRGQNIVGYRNYPDDLVVKFVEKAFEAGIDVFRIFDALNDVRNMRTAVKTVKKVGAHAQGSVCYTISPVHTTKHFVDIAHKLADEGCDSICIKDMAGMLAPNEGYELIQALKKDVELPVHLHCHSTSGMVLMTYWRACEAGVDILDTAFSPLAGGTSQPPVEPLIGGLRNTPFDPQFNMQLLIEIAEYFRELREKYFDPLHLINPISERVDTSILVHQIPGGMFSNLISQLKEQNALDRLKEVLNEVPKVRRELGYPPLVTPTSQLVGIQAVFNVLSGERYKIVPKEVKDYVKGLYGKPPAPVEEKIKRRIIGDETAITTRPADWLKPALGKIPEEVKAYIRSEEDMLTYALFPQAALEYFKKRNSKKDGAPSSEAMGALAEVAAVASAVARYVEGRGRLVTAKKRSVVSPWVLAHRRKYVKQGASYAPL